MSNGQKTVRPFEEGGHYTKVFDPIFDEVMPRCPPNAYKVLMLILRKTRGWQKQSDRLSVRQIRRGTGIRSENTVRAALAWLLDEGLVLMVGDYNRANRVACEYALNETYQVTRTVSNASRKYRGTAPLGVGGGATGSIEGGGPSETVVLNSHPEQRPISSNNDRGEAFGSPVVEGSGLPTEGEYQEWAEAWLSSDPLGGLVVRLIDRATVASPSGRMTWERRWCDHIACIQGWRDTYPEAAVRYALEETERMGKSDIRYAGGVLKNNPGGPDARARRWGNGYGQQPVRRGGALGGFVDGDAPNPYDEAGY